jgi:predicted amidohydrolase
MELIVATSQFPISGDPRANLRHILRQLDEAARRGAHLVHFAETALCGYAGVDLPTLENYPWKELTAATREVMRRARALGLWVVLGSMHRLGDGLKPHNCAYVIDPRGRIHDRYDKLFCTGNREETKSDLLHYSPGDHFVTFRVRGFVCGVLICHDFRYPEVYREYRRRGADVIFHSFHQGGFSLEKARAKGRIHAAVVPAAMQTYAGVNHQWISAANSSRPHSAWPAFTVQPDGMIARQLRPERPGVLITRCGALERYDDSSRSWRDRALAGVLHSGTSVDHPRSRRRRAL